MVSSRAIHPRKPRSGSSTVNYCIQNMAHIRKIPGGFLVNKCISGQVHQKYFSHNRYACEFDAFTAASEYRDGLVRQAEAAKNVPPECRFSGISGVTWCCHLTRLRPEGFMHSFRVEVVGADGLRALRAWSVHRYGLWPAFKQAIVFKALATNDVEVLESAIVEGFLNFMPLYLEHAQQEQNPRLRQGLEHAMSDMLADSNTPFPIRVYYDANPNLF